MRNVLLVTGILMVVGCASGTSIPIGDQPPLPATEPESIFFLIAPPERPHRVVALVEGQASTDDYLTKKQTEKAALNAMKKEAASLGANAIILTGKDRQAYTTGGVTTGNATAYGATFGNAANVSAYGTSVTTFWGAQRITFSGSAIVYED